MRSPKTPLRRWLDVLLGLLAIPLVAFGFWLLAKLIAGAIDCDLGLVSGASGRCPVAGIDLGIPLILMAAPAAFGAFLLLPYGVLVLAWVAYGLLAISVSLLRGRGLAMSPRWMLMGKEMRFARIGLWGLLASLYLAWQVYLL
ncbi:hypothetical protein ACLBXM_22615 [Xanthobacteraceae bacterium A53D]